MTTIKNVKFFMERVESLKLETDNAAKEIINTLKDSSIKLPKGCPSKESMAELVWRGIEKKLSYVNIAAEKVRKSILKP